MTAPRPSDKTCSMEKAGNIAEMTVRAVVIGVLVGVLFGAANAYLGLKVGLTVSASIPAAVMAVSIFRALARSRLATPAGILENNMVQTVGSAGESLAAGVIFTVPALILLGFSPGVLKIFVLGSLGGVLGIILMIPLRRYLIVREHGRLIYPEGTACASVLFAGREGGSGGGLVFSGLGLGAAYEFLVSGMGLWKSRPAWELPRIPAAEVSADSSPALLGVGFVIGPRVAAIMFGGGALAWLVFIPAIKLFGGPGGGTVFPAPLPVSELGAHELWHHYVRYIGAGAVAFGGLVTLVRSLPVIVSSAGEVFRGLVPSGRGASVKDKAFLDLPGPVIIFLLACVVLLMALLPKSMAPGEWSTTLLALVFAFFFAAVSSRIVGLIGSSSNPVSGMTIGALLLTALIFKLAGWTGPGHQSAALTVGALVCISAAIAGDTSQDLKTGYLVGATPWRQQAGEIIGVLTSAAVIGLVVLRLHKAYGIGSEALPAPQATLMSMVVRGVLAGDLPWGLVFIGAAAAAVVELVGVPSLPFAVGLYLPLSLTTPILGGGFVRWLIERRGAGEAEEDGKTAAKGDEKAGHEEEGAGGADSLVKERGVLFASGLIGGAAFVGMALGLLRSFMGPGSLLDAMEVGPGWAGPWQDPASALLLILLALVLFLVSRRKDKSGAMQGSGPGH